MCQRPSEPFHCRVQSGFRRLVEARDDRTCRWPGCENRRRLHAHHRTRWAHGGETSLENLVLIGPETNRNGFGDPLDLALAVSALEGVVG
jgi:hypothetical protein